MKNNRRVYHNELPYCQWSELPVAWLEMSGNLHPSLVLTVVIWNIPSRSTGCQTFMWWELQLHSRTWTSNCTYNNNDLEVINSSLLFSYYCRFHICNDTMMLLCVERSLEHKIQAHHVFLDFGFISSVPIVLCVIWFESKQGVGWKSENLHPRKYQCITFMGTV